MKAPKFKDFITEQKKQSYKLLVITDEPEKAKTFHTADRLREEAEKLGWKYYLYKLTGGYTTYNDGVRRFHNKEDNKGFVVDKDTVAIIRGSITRKDSWMDLISMLEKDGVCVVNSRQSVSVCTDKYRTFLRLSDYGVPQPRTVLINDPDNLQKSVEELDTKFPIILKTLRGSKGVGVLFVESEKSLDSIVQLIHKQDDDADLLLQEYHKIDYDVRVLVLGGKILSVMKRPVLEGDFRSNVSQGSKPEKLDLTEIEIETSLLAAKAVNGLWTAVDFLPSKNISKEILEFFSDKKNWQTVPSECGYKEIVSIKPFGDIVAKFDTGNSGMSVIHADKMEVKGKQVKWSLLGKTITSDIIRKEEISVGGLRDYDEDRYVIKLNVGFLGGVYETEFTLDDREDRTPILFDREFMNRMNVMVNPNRKYVVTTKYSLE